VSCSELSCFHIISQNQFTIQEMNNQVSASLFPCCCNGVEVRINKHVVQSISPSSGYVCRYVKCCLHNLLFSSFNLLNQEYDSLKMVNFNRRTIYKMFLP